MPSSGKRRRTRTFNSIERTDESGCDQQIGTLIRNATRQPMAPTSIPPRGRPTDALTCPAIAGAGADENHGRAG
jgi:hypothetical protein